MEFILLKTRVPEKLEENSEESRNRKSRTYMQSIFQINYTERSRPIPSILCKHASILLCLKEPACITSSLHCVNAAPQIGTESLVNSKPLPYLPRVNSLMYAGLEILLCFTSNVIAQHLIRNAFVETDVQYTLRSCLRESLDSKPRNE